MTEPLVRYQNLIMDSHRWEAVVLREGDVIISTPPKCGTTWTQLICALLIFQTPDLPRPLRELSVWVDHLTHRADEVVARVAAQEHRRFFKTHTPLDGLPYDERVTYLCVARDPRDAAISWDHHVANTNFEAMLAMREAASGPVDAAPARSVDPTRSPRDRFWDWVDSANPLVGLAALLHHLSTFWQARDRPNVLLLHFEDLQRDLAGQMRALARRLGIEVPEERWPALVHAASFAQMRRRSQEYTPDLRVWRDPSRFFRRGVSGQWRELLDAEDLRRYEARAVTLADPELLTWAHHGPIRTP